jgi:NTE family protein
MIDRLPADRSEVIDRTRDIIFSDKTIYDLRAWKHISRCSELIEKLYDVFDRLAVDKQELISPTEESEIRREYDALIGNFGAEILAIHRIIRNRMESPHILKNADFSLPTIKSLIRQGEEKTIDHLDKREPDAELTELLKLLYL